MTIKEIKDLIAAKILGQGTMVDAGGGLPKILNAICEILEGIPAPQVQSDWSQTDTSKPDFIKNKPTIPSPYTLPAATADILGGVKVGSGLSIADGVLSASGGGGALIIEGEVRNNVFHPYEGQPSMDDAFSAIAEGRDVLIKYEYDENPRYLHWLDANEADGQITFGGSISW
jgi:hypothetical protein